MLLTFRNDRAFEEAARSDEVCDKLLLRLQRTRRLIFASDLTFCLIALALGIRASNRISHLTNSMMDAIVSGAPTANANAAMKTLTMQATALAVPFLFIIGLLSMAFWHTDACIKMLILIRGQKARDAAATG